MKYVVDEIIEDKVVIMNIETKETQTIDKSLIETIPYDGMVLDFVDGKYIENVQEYDHRKAEILKKFNKLIKKSK